MVCHTKQNSMNNTQALAIMEVINYTCIHTVMVIKIAAATRQYNSQTN